MRTYYVVFNEDDTVETSFEPVLDHDQYEHIKTRVSDAGNLEYYAHKSKADFYKNVYEVGDVV